jgi:hypothetical protein
VSEQIGDGLDVHAGFQPRDGRSRAILCGRTRDELADQGVVAVIGIGNIEALILHDAEAI